MEVLPEFKYNKDGEEADVQPLYAASCCKLPATIKYLDGIAKPLSHVLKIEYGEICAGAFMMWPTLAVDGAPQAAFVYVHNAEQIVDRLAKQVNWPTPEPEPAEDEEEAEGETCYRDYIKNVAGRLCRSVKKGKDEYVWERLTNFAITQVLAIYEHTESDRQPIFRLKCEYRKPHTTGARILHIVPEKPLTIAETPQWDILVAEVLVPLGELKDDKELRKLFTNTAAELLAPHLSLAQLHDYLDKMQPWPKAR